MNMLILSIIPAAVLLIYIFRQDKIEKEPLRMLVGLFALGALTTVSAIVIGTAADRLVTLFIRPDSLVYLLIDNFLIVALVEEGGKYFVLKKRTWNSPQFKIAEDRIALYFKVGANISGWRTYVMYTDDKAERWTDPVELVEGDRSGGRGPVKNPPIMTSSRLVLAPASVERGSWNSFVDISYDNGESWERGQNVPLPDVVTDDDARGNILGVIQPTLWEYSSGRIGMLLRTNAGWIYRSDSADWGRTWSVARPTSLANNNSGLCVARFNDGRLLLAANPITGNWGARNVLSLFVSADNGETWGKLFDIENDSERSHEFSYPTVIALDGDNFALTYTYMRKSIVFARGKL